MSLIFAACGGDSETDEETTTTAAAAETTTTTEATTETTEPTDDTEPMDGEILTDFGVDLEAGTISIGLLSDLTGVFSALVNPVVTGYEAQVEQINANGGIHGLEIVLEVRDTVYTVDTHVQLYSEIRDEVVAIGHSTGSPHSVAIAPQLAEDSMLAVPLTWYSGWSDPALNQNLIPHGIPYCLEAMNVLGYVSDNMPDASTIAIASQAGDFGEDSAVGAKLAAEALGFEVVYDGQAEINPADESSLGAVANQIVSSGADIVWVATSPGAYAGIYGQALAGGFTPMVWSGVFVAWQFPLIGPDSPLADAVQRDMIFSLPFPNWSSDNPGTQAAVEAIRAYAPDAPSYEYYLEGVGEAILMEQVLNAAYESGDMTRAGVLAAAKSLESVSWNGLWPEESYAGEPNDIVNRTSFMVRPNAEDLAAGGSGLEILEENYTHPITEAYQFDGACFEAFG
jgi:ABC-type branched-subunit amino acid transport system substrate-binding protein